MQLLEHLYDALRAEYGVVISSESPEKLRQKLYPLRKENPEFHILSLVISPTKPDSDLWIVKTSPTEEL